MLQKALVFLGFRLPEASFREPDHQTLMRSALDRVEAAQQMLREARSLEELDLARAALQQAQAEVQHVIRTAKRDRGIALKPIAETEMVYRRLWERLKAGRGDDETRDTGDPTDGAVI